MFYVTLYHFVTVSLSCSSFVLLKATLEGLKSERFGCIYLIFGAICMPVSLFGLSMRVVYLFILFFLYFD